MRHRRLSRFAARRRVETCSPPFQGLRRTAPVKGPSRCESSLPDDRDDRSRALSAVWRSEWLPDRSRVRDVLVLRDARARYRAQPRSGRSAKPCMYLSTLCQRRRSRTPPTRHALDETLMLRRREASSIADGRPDFFARRDTHCMIRRQRNGALRSNR